MGVADSLTTAFTRPALANYRQNHCIRLRALHQLEISEKPLSRLIARYGRVSSFFPPPHPPIPASASLAIECKGGIVGRIESAERKHKRGRGSKESRRLASTTLFDRKKFPNERKWIVTRELMTLLVEYRGILCWRNNERKLSMWSMLTLIAL